MCFENRINQIVSKNSIEEIAEAFYNDNFIHYQAFQFKHLIFVSDASPSGTGILEVAVLNHIEQTQIESITVGWCKSLKDVIRGFNNCLTITEPIRKIILPTSENPPKLVSLTCGCCGNSFEADYTYQQQFDQDSGYGICKKCECYYL